MLPCVHNAEEGKSNAAAAAASARLAAGAQSAGHGQERTGRFQPRLQDGAPLAIRTRRWALLRRLDLLLFPQVAVLLREVGVGARGVTPEKWH